MQEAAALEAGSEGAEKHVAQPRPGATMRIPRREGTKVGLLHKLSVRSGASLTSLVRTVCDPNARPLLCHNSVRLLVYPPLSVFILSALRASQRMTTNSFAALAIAALQRLHLRHHAYRR